MQLPCDNIDFQMIVKRAEMQATVLQTVKLGEISYDSDKDILASIALNDAYKSFLLLMKSDVQQTQEEIIEDKAEAGEDRRETRDDIKETKEKNNKKSSGRRKKR